MSTQSAGDLAEEQRRVFSASTATSRSPDFLPRTRQLGSVEANHFVEAAADRVKGATNVEAVVAFLVAGTPLRVCRNGTVGVGC